MRPLAVFLNGRAITELGLRGEAISDDSFLLLLNPTAEDTEMTLPDGPFGDTWQPILDTAEVEAAHEDPPQPAGSLYTVISRSVVVMRRG